MKVVAPRPGVKREAAAEEKQRILLFTGHMIDAPDRPKPRFPAEKEAVAKEAIKQAITGDLAETSDRAQGIAGGASGGDILFHEICRELNIETTLHLALPREEFIKESVQKAGPDWVQRFDNLYQTLPHRVLTASEKLPNWLGDKQDEYSVWQRSNLWMLSNAFALDESGGAHVTLIALWDGEAGDGPGGTKDMVERAQERGAKTIILNTKSLFGLGQ